MNVNFVAFTVYGTNKEVQINPFRVDAFIDGEDHTLIFCSGCMSPFNVKESLPTVRTRLMNAAIAAQPEVRSNGD